MALVLHAPCVTQVAQNIPGVIPPIYDPTGNGGSAAYDIYDVNTRPNDVVPYLAGDVVSGVFLFPGVGIAGSPIVIIGTQLEIDISTVPLAMTSFKMHLYNVTPPSALADNAPFDIPAGDRAAYLGWVDMGTPVDYGATLESEVNAINKQIDLLSANIWGYLVTAGGYTPAAQEVYKATLHTYTV